MKRICLDVNVAMKWVIPEADSDKALELREDFRKSLLELIAPDFFPVEAVHAVTRAERQGRITAAEGRAFIMSLIAGMPELHVTSPDLVPEAYAISSKFRQGAYDCFYVALAEREGCELWTADDKMVKKLQPTYPFIRHLNTF